MRLSMKKLKIVTFKIEPEVLAEFDSLVAKRGLLRSEMIRLLIQQFIYKHKGVHEGESKQESRRLRFIE